MTIKTKITPLGAGNTVYPKDFVVFESSTPGTYTFEIKKAQFEVTGSGAGGGGGRGGPARPAVHRGAVGAEGGLLLPRRTELSAKRLALRQDACEQKVNF